MWTWMLNDKIAYKEKQQFLEKVVLTIHSGNGIRESVNTPCRLTAGVYYVSYTSWVPPTKEKALMVTVNTNIA